MDFSKSKRQEVKILKQKWITAVLIDAEKDVFGILNIPNELETFYALLGCSCIDITARRIGKYSKKVFEIVCDDEGLLVESPKISAIDSSGQAQLVGNLLIVGPADQEGNLTSLTMDDADHILSKVRLIATKNFKDPYPILTQCEYA